MTIRDLILRYEVDAQTRIETLQEEKTAMMEQLGDDEDLLRDFEDQIAHWRATLVDIVTVIEREGLR